MRTPKDYCLLCKTNKASRKNSHILPKFLSTKFLGEEGSKRGFHLSSNKPIDRQKRIVQDSPKEDYILCDECESYFAILERVSSGFFKNWPENLGNEGFTLKQITDDFSLLKYLNPNAKSLRLLIYSIFWRAGISNHDFFNNFKIDQTFQDKLRTTLLIYRSPRQNEFQQLLTKHPAFEVFPFSMITAESFEDATSNLLLALPYNRGHRLIVDQYSFLLFRDESEIPEDLFKWAGNLSLDDCRMMIFSPELWKSAIIKAAFEYYKKSSNKDNDKNC